MVARVSNDSDGRVYCSCNLVKQRKMMKVLNTISISGAQVLPLVEGGKGIGASNGISAGAWAAAGGVGTFSGVFADLYDDNGELVPLRFFGKTRRERSYELMRHTIAAGISQARIAHQKAAGQGRVHMNMLWGLANVESVLHGILEKTNKIIHGVVCGAGLPFKLAEIASKYSVYYYPIVSSARAFEILWRRAYSKFPRWLGGIVFEDPWRAGGHVGLSSNEDPYTPEEPYDRVKLLRDSLRKYNLHHIPIIIAGGVWFLSQLHGWIDNDELGPVAFQFGTRSLLTQESPIPDAWKAKLLTIDRNDVVLNHFSPTGYYSMSVNNGFIKELQERSARQIGYADEQNEEFCHLLEVGGKRSVYIRGDDIEKVREWRVAGFTKAMLTPDSTAIFVTDEIAAVILEDLKNCAGCLAGCNFSGWIDNEEVAKTAKSSSDPRSYCIRRTLHDIIHGKSVEDNLMFAGTNAYMFKEDPLYAGGFIPTVKELIENIKNGK